MVTCFKALIMIYDLISLMVVCLSYRLSHVILFSICGWNCTVKLVYLEIYSGISWEFIFHVHWICFMGTMDRHLLGPWLWLSQWSGVTVVLWTLCKVRYLFGDLLGSFGPLWRFIISNVLCFFILIKENSLALLV